LANVRLRRNNWLGAEEVAVTLRELGDASKRISTQVLSASLSGQKKYDESIKVLQTAFGTTPTAVQPTIALFNAFVRAGKLDDAGAFVRNLLDANPKNAVAHVLLGSLHLQQGRRGDAEDSFRRAMSVQPGQSAGYRALASLLAREKKYQDAERVQREGLVNLVKAHDGLSQGLEKRNKKRQALLLRASLAAILERAGKFEGAIKEYEILLTEQPASPIFSNNLASLLADYRDDEASLKRAHSLAKRFKNTRVSFFKDTLGWIYFRKGEYEPAVVMLKEARDGTPNVPLVHYHLGRAYNAVNVKPLAKEELEKALELAKDAEFPQRDEAKKILKQMESEATQ
jgi:predicted Zn-dependent protease